MSEQPWVAAFKARLWRAASYELQSSATRAYRKAIKNGELTPGPCAVCGTTERIHGHHEDYAKPLEVTWLCTIHHSWRHRYSESVEQMRAWSAA